MERRGRPPAAGLLKSQCMASWIEVKVEAFEAIDKRCRGEMGDEMAESRETR
jgi:hypothetical protein